MVLLRFTHLCHNHVGVRKQKHGSSVLETERNTKFTVFILCYKVLQKK